MNFRYLIGNRQQCGHRAEGHAPEIHIKPGNYYADSLVCKRITHIGQIVVKELCFIDSYNIVTNCLL